MTDTTQKVEPTDAREASKSRVVTQETLLASLAPPASVEPTEETKVEDKPKEGEQKPAKKGPQERITALVQRSKEAEAKADAAERRAQELEAKLTAALEARAQPMEEAAKPLRSNFASEDEYVEALADWKATAAIAKREREQLQARQQAEQAEIAQQWDRRQQKAIEAIPDYAEIVGSSEVSIPPYVHQALLESEVGPEIVYYLALHPEEARRIASVKPLAAIKQIAKLEDELKQSGDESEPEPKASEPPKKSKAPEPINPVKNTGSSNPGKAESYEEYKRRRLASKGR